MGEKCFSLYRRSTGRNKQNGFFMKKEPETGDLVLYLEMRDKGKDISILCSQLMEFIK